MRRFMSSHMGICSQLKHSVVSNDSANADSEGTVCSESLLSAHDPKVHFLLGGAHMILPLCSRILPLGCSIFMVDKINSTISISSLF